MKKIIIELALSQKYAWIIKIVSNFLFIIKMK
jgi:hypothetical protein